MKHAKDMTETERKAALDEIKRGVTKTFEPLPTSKRATDMTAAERAEWLAEHKRRFS